MNRDEELLADRAVVGLDDDEANELRALGRDGDESYDLAAAAIDLATLSIQPMPAGLAERVMAARAPQAMKIPTTLAGWSMPQIAKQAPAKRRRRMAPWLGAFAAAAVVIVGLSWWLLRATPSVSDDRADLLAGGATRIDWKATPEAPATTGDVVWSASAQRGYMRFVGLAPNDPTKTQYQLWIFDKTRDQAFPVDGGVFDVTSTGEVIVPIAAKLHVDDATLFAVTVERPGGVVVSKREHVVVLAGRS